MTEEDKTTEIKITQEKLEDEYVIYRFHVTDDEDCE